jgi:transposase InsO family protein
VLSITGLSAGSYYNRPTVVESPAAKGAKPSRTTLTLGGVAVGNEVIVDVIKGLLSQEFVDYGYFKVYHYLKRSYVINHKKVYRLMKCNKLLYTAKQFKVGTKQWVKELVPRPDAAFSYREFDIKFMYVAGTGKYSPLLTVIDVKSRWVLGHLCQRGIKQEDVRALMDELVETYVIPEKITVRCDNGSQFESSLIREYFKEKKVVQEFTKPATPEQNAHIESYHSILERVICRQYLFEKESDLLEKVNKWALFYNYERIHSGTNFTSPYEALLQVGVDVNKLFKKKEPTNNCIFIPLNEKELGNAGVQPNRDSLTDRNK